MAYRKSAVRSPPRNFKVNFIEEPPLNTVQVNFISSLVPKIARKCTTAEDIQSELSKELCQYLQKSIGVYVSEKKDSTLPEVPSNHMVPVTFKFSMNEFLYKIWIHDDQVEF